MKKSTFLFHLILIFSFGCQKEIVSLDSDSIDKTTDNINHLNDFKKSLKKVELKLPNNGIKIGELDFKILWNSNLKIYEICPIVNLDFTECNNQINLDSKSIGIESDFFLAGMGLMIDNANFSMSWALPYSEFKNKNGMINLNTSDFEKFRRNGNINDKIRKGASGHIQFNTLKPVSNTYSVVTSVILKFDL